MVDTAADSTARKGAWCIVGMLIAMLASEVTLAAEVRGKLSTVLVGRETLAPGVESGGAENRRVADVTADYPLYALASLDVEDLDIPGFDEARFVLHGYGKLQLASDQQHDANGDFQGLHIDARNEHLQLRLGRQLSSMGAGAVTLLDAVTVSYRPALGLSFGVMAGYVAKTGFMDNGTQWQAAGRMGWRPSLTSETGVAIVQQQDHGAVIQRNLGWDGMAQIGPWRISGVATVAASEWSLAAGRAAVGYALQSELQVTADAARACTAVLLPRTSVLSVFASDWRDTAGGDVAWDPSAYYSAALQGHALWSDGRKLGYRAAARAVTYREPSHRSLLGLDVERLRESANGYVRGRAYTRLQISAPVRISVDLYSYRYDAAINGLLASHVGQMSITYDPVPAWQVATTVSVGSTPYARSQMEAYLRVSYGQAMDLAREWQP